MQKPRILVADDMPLNFLVIENLLSHTECQLVFASNGKEAVDEFIKGCYQLILLDLRMPVMDGLGAARVIRQIESSRNNGIVKTGSVPVIILSASLDDRRAALEAGCDDYLVKPLDEDMLSQMFAKHMKQYSAQILPVIRQAPDRLSLAVNYPHPGIR